MPDLPAEVWSLVVKHFEGEEKCKAGLCAIARVSSNANTAASAPIYERAQVADFDAFFYGYNHIPTAKRQPKSYWLATTTTIRASFSYYDLAPRMGPILTQLLGTHNHHERLAELLPKLSKLQLVSDLQTPLNDPSRQPSNEQCWSPISLPAQHICQTVHESLKFPQVVRPLPSSITLHYYVGYPLEASLIVPIFDFTNDHEITVCDVTIVCGRPIGYLPHEMYERDVEYIWDAVCDTVDGQLEPSILAQQSRTHVDRLKFMTYGMFCRRNDSHRRVCQCGDEEKHKIELLNKMKHSILSSRGGDRISYDVKYDSLDKAPACRACGEK